MAKKKANKITEEEVFVEEEVSAKEEEVSPADFIVNSTEEENKENVLAILENSIKFLEETGGNKEMLKQFMSAKKKLS